MPSLDALVQQRCREDGGMHGIGTVVGLRDLGMARYPAHIERVDPWKAGLTCRLRVVDLRMWKTSAKELVRTSAPSDATGTRTQGRTIRARNGRCLVGFRRVGFKMRLCPVFKCLGLDSDRTDSLVTLSLSQDIFGQIHLIYKFGMTNDTSEHSIDSEYCLGQSWLPKPQVQSRGTRLVLSLLECKVCSTIWIDYKSKNPNDYHT